MWPTCATAVVHFARKMREELVVAGSSSSRMWRELLAGRLARGRVGGRFARRAGEQGSRERVTRRGLRNDEEDAEDYEAKERMDDEAK